MPTKSKLSKGNNIIAWNSLKFSTLKLNSAKDGTTPISTYIVYFDLSIVIP